MKWWIMKLGCIVLASLQSITVIAQERLSREDRAFPERDDIDLDDTGSFSDALPPTEELVWVLFLIFMVVWLRSMTHKEHRAGCTACLIFMAVVAYLLFKLFVADYDL